MALDLETWESEDQHFRAHSERWESFARCHVPFGEEVDGRSGWSPRVDASLAEFIESEGSRERLKESVAIWERENPQGMQVAEAIDAIEDVEPQLVIERLLSAGWGSESQRWWRRAEDGQMDGSEPDFCIPSDSVGPEPFRSDYRKLHGYSELQDYWYLEASDLGVSKAKKKTK